MSLFDSLVPKVKSGQEVFNAFGKQTSFNLLNFWRWSVSDLVSNATRGRLAEFIVAMALDCDLSGVRDEWQAWDLTTPGNLRVEVKSAAYLQSWGQKELSVIRFSIKESFEWKRDDGKFEKDGQRQGDLYVFALLRHQVKETLDPLNLDQWVFYVVSTANLNTRFGQRKTITLKGLNEIGIEPIEFGRVKQAVNALGISDE